MFFETSVMPLYWNQCDYFIFQNWILVGTWRAVAHPVVWRQWQRTNVKPLSLTLHLWSSLNSSFWCGEVHLLIGRDCPVDVMSVHYSVSPSFLSPHFFFILFLFISEYHVIVSQWACCWTVSVPVETVTVTLILSKEGRVFKYGHRNCDFLILNNVLKCRLSTRMHAIKKMSKCKQLFKNIFKSKLSLKHKIALPI